MDNGFGFKKGDDVEVIDSGLLMLQRFAPEGSYPNNWGKVEDIEPDGTIIVAFPIDGEEDSDEHYQIAPYNAGMVRHRYNI